MTAKSQFKKLQFPEPTVKNVQLFQKKSPEWN